MAKIDRAIAETKLKQFIRHGEQLTTKALYELSIKELCWNCHLCEECEFMSIKSFREWLKTFKWLESKQLASNSAMLWSRCDNRSNEKSALGKLVDRFMESGFVVAGCGICRK
jgi:hypothetical protein